MRTMKDSGFEWIGSIPETWEIGQIGHLYAERKEKVSDYDFPPLSVTMKGIVPQLSTAAKTDAHDDRKLVRAGDFVINSRSDRRGSCGISEYDGSVSLINTILTPRNEMNPHFYDWLFHTTMFADEFYKWGHGIVDDLWTTNWSDMKKIVVPIPPLNEQEVIASFIEEHCSYVDSVIEKTRIAIDEYKKLRQAVITRAITRGIEEADTLVDSNNPMIGEIASDRKITKVKFIASKVTDGAHISPEYDENGYDYISTVNIANGKIDFEGCIKTSKESYETFVRTGCQPHKNDVLISKDGSVGKTVIIDYDRDFVVGSSLVIISPLLDLISPEYLNYNLLSEFVQSQLLMVMHGTALKRVSVEKNANLPIVLVNKEKQDRIVSYLNEKCFYIDSLIKKKESFLLEIENYKKAFIYEYVTGKKEVPHS